MESVHPDGGWQGTLCFPRAAAPLSKPSLPSLSALLPAPGSGVAAERRQVRTLAPPLGPPGAWGHPPGWRPEHWRGLSSTPGPDPLDARSTPNRHHLQCRHTSPHAPGGGCRSPTPQVRPTAA